MAKTVKKGHEIATIDVLLVTVTTNEETPRELGLKTANQIQVDTETEVTEAIKLIIKGVLHAQKRGVTTITGTTLTLSDNVFNPELVQIIQGGEITYESDGSFKKYTPPVVGAEYTPIPFEVNVYTARYDTSGLMVGILRTTYPNCTGDPVAFDAQDDTFFAPEYKITSAPAEGQSYMTIEMVPVDELPTLSNADWVNEAE